MEGTMKVCVLTGQRQLEWTEREIPQPAAGELQIKLEYVGICGSDLHFFDQGRLANWELDGPLALGHEPGGVVTAIGEGVTGFEVGDKVLQTSGEHGYYGRRTSGAINSRYAWNRTFRCQTW